VHAQMFPTVVHRRLRIGLRSRRVAGWPNPRDPMMESITFLSIELPVPHGSIIGPVRHRMSPAESNIAEKNYWDRSFSDRFNTHFPIAKRWRIRSSPPIERRLKGEGYNLASVGLLLDRIAFPESASQRLTICHHFVASQPTYKRAGVVLHDAVSSGFAGFDGVPGVFTPVEINDRVLADGGMVQNIPVETARYECGCCVAVELRSLRATVRSSRHLPAFCLAVDS